MYGGRSTLLSGSSRYRMAATLQVAMAIEDDSDAVLFDAADILDSAGRNGLIKLAQAADLPVLVCMTMRQEQVPDLAKIGGASYWLNDGEAVKI
jgi:hypothetical protein